MGKNRPIVTLPALPALSSPSSIDRADLRRLALCLVLVPLVWVVALGWRGNTLLGAVDQIDSTFLLVRDFQSQCGGDFTCFLYRPDLNGGVKIHDVMGTMPIFRLLAATPLGPIAILNLTTLFAQVACAFLGLRAAVDLAAAWTGRPVEPGLLAASGIILVTAFAPEIGWRIAVGHISTPMGASVWIAAFGLLLAARNDTLSWTHLSVVVVLVWNALAWIGAIQHVVYGPFFGGLVLFAALVSVRSGSRLAIAVLAMVGAALLGAQALAGMIDHIAGSDAARSFGRSVIYAFTTATRRDWRGSLYWGASLIPSGRPHVYDHETNYPIGPLILLVALIPIRRAALLILGLAVALVVPVLFSMNHPGVADRLTTLYPPLHGFRVPARAIIPFLHYLPIAAAAALLRFEIRARSPMIAAGALAGITLFFAPPLMREWLGWILASAIVIAGLLRRPIPAGAALIALGLGTLGAFAERQRPFATKQSLIDMPARAGDEIRNLAPALRDPLVRADAAFQLPPFEHNPAQAAGISSLNGYLNPPRRFIALIAALDGVAPDYTVNSFRFARDSASLRALAPIYNESFRVSGVPGDMHVEPLAPTAGPAWFAARIEPLPGIEAIAAALRNAGDAIVPAVRARMWIDSKDVVPGQSIPATFSPECGKAEVLGVEAARGGQAFRVRVRTTADCPLALATNYATNLRATSGAKALPVFPAYGALAAVIVPAGADEITIEARAVIPMWSRIAGGLGVLLIGLSAWMIRRGRRRSDQTRAGSGSS